MNFIHIVFLLPCVFTARIYEQDTTQPITGKKVNLKEVLERGMTFERATENKEIKDIKGIEDDEFVRYGDMMMDDKQDDMIFGDKKKNKKKSHGKKDIVADMMKHWPNKIPYIIHSSLDNIPNAIEQINASWAELKEKTCLTPVLRTNEHDYIMFYRSIGCWSHLGRRGGPQYISVGQGCEIKVAILHEILHALGFVHEHQRSDRDDYISIKWDHIKEGKGHNFDKQSIEMTTYDQPYDYDSIMQYRADAFGKECPECLTHYETTLAKKDDPITFYHFGQGYYGGLSAIDQRQLNIMHCEEPRPFEAISEGGRLGLSNFIRLRLQEYPQVITPGFHDVMTTTLQKVYPGFKFSVSSFKDGNNAKNTSFICQNCSDGLTSDNVRLLVAYTQDAENATSLNEAERNSIGDCLKSKIEEMQLCHAGHISTYVLTNLVETGRSVAMVLTTNVRDAQLLKDNDSCSQMSFFVSCNDENDPEDGYVIVVFFGN